MPVFRRGGRPGLIGMAARTAVVAGTATAVSGGVARHQQNRANEQAEQQQAAAAQAQQAQAQQAAQQAQAQPAADASGVSSSATMVGEIERLAAMHQQGILSDEEFAAAKSKMLS